MDEFFYRVKVGETLISISDKLKVPPYKIIADNFLKSEVKAGQVLVIRKLNRPLYRVKPFDTIKGICARHNLDEKDFIFYNRTDFIYCGILIYL